MWSNLRAVMTMSQIVPLVDPTTLKREPQIILIIDPPLVPPTQSKDTIWNQFLCSSIDKQYSCTMLI